MKKVGSADSQTSPTIISNIKLTHPIALCRGVRIFNFLPLTSYLLLFTSNLPHTPYLSKTFKNRGYLRFTECAKSLSTSYFRQAPKMHIDFQSSFTFAKFIIFFLFLCAKHKDLYAPPYSLLTQAIIKSALSIIH